MTLESVW